MKRNGVEKGLKNIGKIKFSKFSRNHRIKYEGNQERAKEKYLNKTKRKF
jgi:hypothetical protein